MTAQEWKDCNDCWDMVDVVENKGTERQWRLLIRAVIRRNWAQLPRVARTAVEMAELYADGKVNVKALRSADREIYNYRLNYKFKSKNITLTALNTALICTFDGDWKEDARAYDGVTDAFVDAARVSGTKEAEYAIYCQIIRDIFGNNPFEESKYAVPIVKSKAKHLANKIYENGAFYRVPELATILEKTNCDILILDHCREKREHVRGCWVIDLLKKAA